MRRVCTTKAVYGDPAFVWDVVTDYQNFGWRGDLASIRVTKQDSTYLVTETMRTGIAANFTVTLWCPNEAYQQTMNSPMVSRSWGIRLKPGSAGRTTVTVCEEYRFKHKWMQVASYFYLPVKAGQKQYLKQLSKHLKALQDAKEIQSCD